MIEWIIAASARNKLLTFILVGGLAFWGYQSLRRTPLDAIPDLSDVQVIVYSEWMGRSPDLVEDQITYPLVSRMLGAPNVRYVRGQSMFGMSFVSVIFEDGTDIYWARSRVLEYLNGMAGQFPEGVSPLMGPDATGVGWVFEYALRDVSGKHDLAELRSLQDWQLRYALQSVPGVAEVASVGGFVKEYQIDLDPNKMRAFDVSLNEVMMAVGRSNQDVGGRAIEIAASEYVVRGRGYVKSIEDLAIVPVKMSGGKTSAAMGGGKTPASMGETKGETKESGGEGGANVPVLLRDLGHIHLGPALRRGAAELNGEGETAGGIVVMRYGKNALTVIDGVKAKLKELEKSLPAGVEIVVTYDRSELIRKAIDNLRLKLLEEMLVVSLVIGIFLWHFRSALVAILTLPIAILLSFIPMESMGLTANIMSLGGIAIAIGAMVDAAIIFVENAHKRLEDWEAAGKPGNREDVMIQAFQEVGRPLFFSLLVITVSFLPVFTLQGQEGRLFQPLAYTKTFSMGFAALLAITFTPALGMLLIRGKIVREEANPVTRLLIAIYEPAANFSLRHPKAIIGGSILLVLLTLPVVSKLGGEFMPPLNEGSILYMPTSVPGMGADEAVSLLQKQDAMLKSFPEVRSVFGKAGRAETATDPAPLSMFETVIELKPESEWREGMTFEKLMGEMDAKLAFPGMPNTFWMPIQTRTEMLATGLRSALGIKVLGDDAASIQKTAEELERILTKVPGARNAFAERIGQGNYLDLEVDRMAAARYGLTVGDVTDVIEMALGGATVSRTIEGRERYPITVRYARDFRDDAEAIRRVLVDTPGGAKIPLGSLVTIHYRTGPPMINSENAKLVNIVVVNVDPAVGISEYVGRARETVARELTLPAGVRLEWAGQFQYWERAVERLKVVVPITLLIVFFLIYLNSKSLPETLIVLMAVPFSLVGAFWILYFLGYKMSVAVWVGLIALAGLDAETGIVMLVYLDQSLRSAKESGKLQSLVQLKEAVLHGAVKRIRPKAMTVMVILFGLLPIMWSTGTGSDVMKRIAAPMVGGIITSALLELLVYPAIYFLWKRKSLRIAS